VQEGADILDVGGESTRPNAYAVRVEEELRRVVPAIEKIASAVAAPISIDTCKFEVAELAIRAGASMINDQWGLKHDLRLADLAAEHGIPIILMSKPAG